MDGRRYFYLHGFASSPKSLKAQYFKERFAEAGRNLEVLPLDQGDFENLTISGQLRVIGEAARGGSPILIGSSLGGYLAALYASRHPEVERLALLAPAFRFPTYYPTRLGEDTLAKWRASGKLRVHHYADGAERDLRYEFIRDGLQYESEPDVRQPVLLIHGTRDDVVPAEFSTTWAKERPNVEMHLFDSGHELKDVLDPAWELMARFVGLRGAGR